MFHSVVTSPPESGTLPGPPIAGAPPRRWRSAADRCALGAKDAVGKPDRRRPWGPNPTSRQSRSARARSHRQGRECPMGPSAIAPVSYVSFVGVDVAKESAEGQLLPEGRAVTPKSPADLVRGARTLAGPVL